MGRSLRHWWSFGPPALPVFHRLVRVSVGGSRATRVALLRLMGAAKDHRRAALMVKYKGARTPPGRSTVVVLCGCQQVRCLRDPVCAASPPTLLHINKTLTLSIYTLIQAKRIFQDFRATECYALLMCAPPLAGRLLFWILESKHG